MRQLIKARLSPWARWLLLASVCMYFAAGLGLLALRYVVSPQADQWRGQIAAYLTQALGTTVELGPLQVTWNGWDPSVRVQDLRLEAADGPALLTVPLVQARLNWRGLLQGSQGALRLQVTGMELDVQRLANGRISLLGMTFDWDDPAIALPPWLGWVLAQPVIAFHQVTVRWHDRLRAAPVLQFDQVEAQWRNSPGAGPSLLVAARAVVGAGADVRLQAQAADFQPVLEGRWPAGARAWLQLSGFRPADWQPWLSQVPRAWQRGTIDVQAWLDGVGSGAAPQLTLLGALDALGWQAAEGAGLQVPALHFWLQGQAAAWRALAAGMNESQPLAFEARGHRLQVAVPALFAASIDAGDLEVRGQVARPGGWSLAFDQIRWRNADIDLQASGSWKSGGKAGVADLKGSIARANLAAIHRYLPFAVSADAREWLAHGLQAGTLDHGHWRLRGDLAHFPFGEQPQAGDFSVEGNFHDARIDLVPDSGPALAWPLLQVAAGHASLQRMDLRLQGFVASMEPQPGNVIALSAVQARIPDMEHAPVLTVSGLSSASGATYMALIRHSPLARLLDGVFNEARASGDWQVPLALTVPLLHSEETAVQGRVDVRGASLQFLPRAPAFQALVGQVYFSESGIRIPLPLKGQLLGGPVQVRGALGGSGAPGLSFGGRMTVAAVDHFIAVPGMKRITGQMDYQAQLKRQKRGHVLELESDTTGIAIDFPAPLSKAADQARTLRVRWSDVDPHDDTLEVRYGSSLQADLSHRRGAPGPYFQQAAVGLGQAAPAGQGLRIEIAYPLFDLDRWNRIVDEFSIVRRGHELAARGNTPNLWPDLALLSVQADQLRLLGTRLDHAVLRIVRADDERWSLNVRSNQTTGTLKWQERGGRVVGNMSGRFARFSLGDDPADNYALLPDVQPDEKSEFDDDLEIPGIVLQADDFRLYGRSLGALTLEGSRDGVLHVWHLDRLRINRGPTRLQGTGLWRLRGPQRGLSLNAAVTTTDLGAWMEQAGWKGALAGGAGDIKGHLEWRNLPWTHDKADLQGTLQVALAKGRLPRLGSHTAKLLELLSLQSVLRLNRLDIGLAGLLKEGVPFDQLSGSVRLDHGAAQIRDYKVIGSAGTILLEGDTNIVDETLNLQAVVVPNLDVSGAALAAAIAVNPLVGLGAFVTQWLLKAPLAKAMAAHYRITGTWDDPQVKEVSVVPAPAREAPVR